MTEKYVKLVKNRQDFPSTFNIEQTTDVMVGAEVHTIKGKIKITVREQNTNGQGKLLIQMAITFKNRRISVIQTMQNHS